MAFQDNEQFVAVVFQTPKRENYAAAFKEAFSSHPKLSLYSVPTFEDVLQLPIYGKINILITNRLIEWQSRRLLQENPVTWIQVLSCGVKSYLYPDFVNGPVALTNIRGVNSQMMAEYVFACLLHFSKKINILETNKAAMRWEMVSMNAINTQTMLIIGLGDIGKAVAKIGKLGFQMRILGINRSGKACEYADEVHTMESLHFLLPLADAVIMSLPGLSELNNLIGTTELNLMKPSAVLVNVGRGLQLDESALVSALRRGKIAGAALDVFKEEPLPSESHLWDCPNLMISGHCVYLHPSIEKKCCELFARNLELFLKGKIEESYSIVDKRRGY